MKKLLILMAGALILFSFSCSMNTMPGADETAVIEQGIATDYSQPVELMFAKLTGQCFGSAPTGTDFSGYITVDNIAYTKEVNVVYWNVKDRVWKTEAAQYAFGMDGNREAWTFDIHIDTDWWKGTMDIKFAIEYKVNGQSYWDSNGGANYRLNDGYVPYYPSAVLKDRVVIFDEGKAYANGTYGFSISGSVIVENIAYNKAVSIVYTTDGWATSNTVSASYRKTLRGSNLESWGFQVIESDPSITEFEFAVSYEVDGNTYWDNNFGSNYVLDLPGTVY